MSHEPHANADEVYAHNVADVMDLGPGLRVTRRTAIMAYDPDADKVLIGGLGAMGVGQMWVSRSENDDVTGAPYGKSYDMLAWLRDNPPDPSWLAGMCKTRPCRSMGGGHCIDCGRTFGATR